MSSAPALSRPGRVKRSLVIDNNNNNNPCVCVTFEETTQPETRYFIGLPYPES